MNTGMPNLLLDAPACQRGFGAGSPARTAAKGSKQLPAVPTNNHAVADGTATTDNTTVNAPQNPASEQQQFAHAYGEKIKPPTGLVVPENNGNQNHSAPLGPVAIQPQIIQAWLAKFTQMTEHGQKPVVTKKMILEPGAGLELAQMLAELKASGSPSTKSQTAKPGQTDPAAAVAPGSQTASKIASIVSGKPLVADGSTAEGKNSDQPTVSNKAVGVANNPANQTIAKKTITEILTTAPEKVADNEKLLDANTSTVSADNKKLPNANTSTVSDGQKILPFSDKESPSLMTAAGEKSALTNKPAVSDHQKTPLNTDIPTGHDKSSDQKFQLDSFGLDKPVQPANKPTDNNANTNQQYISNTHTLSKSLHTDDKIDIDNTSSESILTKLSSKQIVSANNIKDTGSLANTDLKNNSSETFKQIFSSDGAQSPVSQQPSNVSAPKPAGSTLPGEASTDVGKQIQESIHSSLRQDGQQITIRLNPPELGKVTIKFHQQDGKITGLLEVSRPQTRAEIQNALPQILQNLAEDGVQIKRLDVMLTNQHQQQAFKDASSATTSGEQHGHGQTGADNDPHPNNPGWTEANQWLTSEQGYTGFAEAQVQITDDSINMLI